MWPAVFAVARNRCTSLAVAARPRLHHLPLTLQSHLSALSIQRSRSHHQPYHDHTLAYRFGMHVAYFRRHPADDAQVHIHFRYVNAALQLDRVFNLSRSAHEPVSACLHRIQANVAKELQRMARRSANKKKKGGGNRDAELIDAGTGIPAAETVELLRDGRLFVDADGAGPESVHQLLDGRPAGLQADLQLSVWGSAFQVAYNLPWVQAVALPDSILSGYFVYPTKLELIGSDYHEAQFEWFVADTADATVWTPVGSTYQWQVTDVCVGRHLKVVCTPRRLDLTGPAVEAVAKQPVLAAPAGECHYVQRHRHTSAPLASTLAFRVVSYNLLADLYADSDFSRSNLFPYIPAAALHIDYRKQLFVRELHGYHADVMCLQEVDAKIFDYDLVPVLGYRRMDGRFQRKGQTAEGVATFWNRDKFDLVESTGINIGESLPQLDILHDMWSAISTNEQLAERIRVRSTAVQVTVLRNRSEPARILCVANTHLYFHPDADHIRLLQFAAAFRYVQAVRERIVAEAAVATSAANVSLVFAGDFNSTPECGVFKLMTEKRVPKDFVDFRSNAAEALANLDLEQPFNMSSAYEWIPFTNYTVGFTECIDYIFYQTDALRCSQTVPPPSEAQLSEHTAIPSIVHPSDHVALVADFEWTN